MQLFIGVLAKDFYEVLGLSKGASDRDIKAQYRKLSKMYHPDKNSSPDAHDKFVEVGEAYEILLNEEKRNNYDKYGSPDGPQGGGGDIFEQFFGFGGGGHHRPQQPRGSDTQVDIKFSLKDFYTGREHEISVQMTNLCDACDATGSRDKVYHRCSKCNGQGMLLHKRQLAPGMFQQFQGPCDACKGTGKTITHKCNECNGEGSKLAVRTYRIYLHPGAERNHRNILDGEGDHRPGETSGNLVMFYREDFTSSWGYRRLGKNLYRTEVLTSQEATKGGWNRLIPFFDNDDPIIVLSRLDGQVVQHGEVEVIKGRGMPYSEEDDLHGDLYIDYVVLNVPTLGVKAKAGHDEL